MAELVPNDEILTNEARAHSFAETISDSTTRNLVMLGIAEARMRAIRRAGRSDAEWRAALPQQPFDMAFFASVLASMFGKAEIIRAVLDGRNLAEASGWDI